MDTAYIDFLGITPKRYYKERSRMDYWCYTHETADDVLQEIAVLMGSERITYDDARGMLVKQRRKERRSGKLAFKVNEKWHYNDRALANFNFEACAYFDELNKLLKANGLPVGEHATYGKEKSIPRFGKYKKIWTGNKVTRCYYVDFFIHEYGIAVEYNEPSHYECESKINSDLYRRQVIERYLDLPIIVVVEGVTTHAEVVRRIKSLIALRRQKERYRVVA